MTWILAQVELVQPAWLVVLAAAVGLIAWAAWRSLANLGRLRGAIVFVLRALLLAALVLALGGLRIARERERPAVVVAVDRSASISEQGRRQADALVKALLAASDGHGVSVLPLAARPAIGPPAKSPAGGQLDASGTNLAAGLEAAIALVARQGGRVVLLSDGNQTEGDAVAVARDAIVPIDTVPLATRPPPALEVAAVDAPGEVRPGEPFEVEVVVRAARPDHGKVTLLRDGQPVAKAAATLAPGENRVRFTRTLLAAGNARWTAALEGFSGPVPQGPTAGTVTLVDKPARVLLVAAEAAAWQPLVEAFRSGPMTIRRIAPGQLPATPAELAETDLVVLGNVPAAALSPASMEALAGYVSQQGGGLIAIGGDRAFTPGGYRHTRLEEVLPVISEADEQPRRPSLALVLVIDQSGSMEEGGAIALAKAAVRRTVQMLGRQDQLGIIAFQDFTTWVVPLGPCRDKQRILDQVDTLKAGGGTNLYPALEKAWLALRQAFARRKHIIVLTDGISHPGDFDGLVKQIARDGVTVSTVGMGKEAAARLLDEMATRGGGHYYRCDNPAAVPRVFALETATVSRLGIREKPLTPRRRETPSALDKLNWQDVPPLLGYVQTRVKEDANVVLSTGQGDPLLAWWRCGKGVSVAFTSDARARWGRSWLGWDQFGRFWVDVARHATRRRRDDRLVLVCRGQQDRLHVTLDATAGDGRWLNGARATATLVDAADEEHPFALRQTAPGRYSGDVRPGRPGICRVEVRFIEQGQDVRVRHGGGFVPGRDDAARAGGPGESLLRDIAGASGGRFDPAPAEVLAAVASGRRGWADCWSYLLAAALILLPLELALRRPGTRK